MRSSSDDGCKLSPGGCLLVCINRKVEFKPNGCIGQAHLAFLLAALEMRNSELLTYRRGLITSQLIGLITSILVLSLLILTAGLLIWCSLHKQNIRAQAELRRRQKLLLASRPVTSDAGSQPTNGGPDGGQHDGDRLDDRYAWLRLDKTRECQEDGTCGERASEMDRNWSEPGKASKIVAFMERLFTRGWIVRLPDEQELEAGQVEREKVGEAQEC
ncbi:unnamed protein product, partial [Protopolystoma xenopodis]